MDSFIETLEPFTRTSTLSVIECRQYMSGEEFFVFQLLCASCARRDGSGYYHFISGDGRGLGCAPRGLVERVLDIAIRQLGVSYSTRSWLGDVFEISLNGSEIFENNEIARLIAWRSRYPFSSRMKEIFT